jgi:hypothetical protein
MIEADGPERIDEFLEYVPRDTLSGSLSLSSDVDRLHPVALGQPEAEEGDDEFSEIDDDADPPAESQLSTSFVSVHEPAPIDDAAFEQFWLAFTIPDAVLMHELYHWSGVGVAPARRVDVVERVFCPVWLSTLRFEVAVDTGATDFCDDAALLSMASLECDQRLVFALLSAHGFTTASMSRLPVPPRFGDAGSPLWRVRKITSDFSAGRLCRLQRGAPDASTRVADVLPFDCAAARADDEPGALTVGERAAARVLARLGLAKDVGTFVTVRSASHQLLWLPVVVAQVNASTVLASGVHGVVVGPPAAGDASRSASDGAGVVGSLLSWFTGQR